MNTHTPLHEKHERFPIIKECIPNTLIDLTFIIIHEITAHVRVHVVTVKSHDNLHSKKKVPL